MSRNIIISILVTIAVIAIGAFFFFRSTPASAAKSVIEKQFIAISIADFEKAYTYLSKDKRESADKDDFRYYVAQHPLLESNVKRTYKNIVTQGLTATAYVDVENVDGEKGGIDVLLVREGDEWKILSYNFVSADVTGQK